MAVAFGLLGEVQVRVSGVAVDLGHARQRCVLAALLLEPNRAQPLDVLAERVWGGQAPHRARDTLYGYLYRLRQALVDVPGATIERTTGGYLLSVDEDAVDLHRFRRLVKRSQAEDDQAALALVEQALALWRGQALSGLEGAWAEAVRRTLAQERWTALLHRNDVALRLGEHAALVAELSALAEQDPLDERLAGQLILALYRCGRQADALEHYQRTRQRLVEELGTDPAPALRELHQRLLAADPELTATGPGPARVPPPRQLPPAPPHFAGRAAEIAELTAALDGAAGGGAVVISAIAGAGGIGKTWLALHWAHRNAHRFPDGQLFVDLHGFSPAKAPVDPTTALRGFLTALGVAPQAVPPDPQAQAGMFRSLVADKRVLVVIDNARGADQVAPLLPGSPTSAVVVTSRNRLTELLTRHGARSLCVDVLSDDEARQVLVDRLGARRVAAEPEAVAELLACCGRLPLALGIVAGRAAAHPGFPLAALAAELRDAATRLAVLDDDNPAASLPTALSWSHEALTAEQARVFLLLGLAPGPDLGLPAACALTGLPPVRARAVLRALEDVHLVQQHAPGRWRMHDLIRLYAADRARDDLAEDDRAAAQRRLLDFLLRTAYAADRLVEPHRPPIALVEPATPCPPQPLADLAAAMDWFTTEHATLLAAQRLAADLGLHAHVWQLAWTLDNFHHRRGQVHAALAAWRAGLAAADHLGDVDTRVLARRQLGHVANDARRPDEAVEHLGQALKLAEHADDRGAQARTHHVLSRVHEQLGDHRRALHHATRALARYRELDLPVWEAGALNEVGWQQARLGEYEPARAHCAAALELARRHGHRDFEAASLDSLGYIAHRTGDHALALERYEEALALYRALGHTSSEAETLEYLGLTHRALGHPDRARDLWRRSAELFRRHHREEDARRVAGHLADAGGDPIV